MVQQFIHGKQYIDELVMMRVADKGDVYIHQDANWNVIGATDLGRHVVERFVYTPYGELTVHQDTGFGDRDGDQDVDSTDKGTVRRNLHGHSKWLVLVDPEQALGFTLVLGSSCVIVG